jgi:hypothetical protein
MPRRLTRRLKRDLIEARAILFMARLFTIVGGSDSRWNALVEIEEASPQAVDRAVERGWVVCERGHSVRMTHEGQQMVLKAAAKAAEEEKRRAPE